MKKNLLKQFGGWVTELTRNQLLMMRLELGVTYVILLFFVFTVFIFFESYRGYKEFYPLTNLPQFFTSGAWVAYLKNTFSLIADYINFLAVIIIGSGVLGYVFTLRAEKPIKKTLDIRERFIANASHELRVPLSIMKTTTEIALSENGLTPGGREALLSNLEEVDRMNEIIKNLFVISRTEALLGKPSFKPVYLDQVVSKAVQAMQSVARQEEILITLERIDSAETRGHAEALEEVVVNILKNAITHTPAGRRVVVNVIDNAPKNVQLIIRDEGSGIAPEDLPHIFDPFFKKTKHGVSEESFGLGLTITKEIVNNHRGQIKVDSKLGEGTIVTVTLPSA